MNELWFQQNFLGDRVSIRVGQLGADSEFALSTHSIVFLNATFGWSPYLSENIPNGGPAYPMGTPGIRLALMPVNWLSYQALSFRETLSPKMLIAHGFRWDLSASNGYFSIHELTFRLNQQSESSEFAWHVQDWWLVDTAPVPNANSTQPWSYGFYFVADQMLYREAHSDVAPVTDIRASKLALNRQQIRDWACLHILGLSPQNSSFINFYIDGGLTYKGLIPSRDNDVLGVAVAYGHLTNDPQDKQGRSTPG